MLDVFQSSVREGVGQSTSSNCQGFWHSLLHFDMPFTCVNRFIDTCPDAPCALHWRKHSVSARFLNIRLEAIYRLQSSASVDGDLIWSIAYEVSIFLM